MGICVVLNDYPPSLWPIKRRTVRLLLVTACNLILRYLHTNLLVGDLEIGKGSTVGAR